MELVFIREILLTVLILLEIAVMIYLLYINHKRFQEDKKFWKHNDEVFSKIIEDMRNQPAIMLDTEENKNEQEQPETSNKK